MDSTNRIERLPGVGREAEHAPYIEALRRYLIERRYAGQTVHSYANCAGHFLRWTQGEQLDLVHIDEVAVARFADEHLTRCRCGWPTRTDRHEAHAAIGHLLMVLRTLGVTAARSVGATPVDEELRRFDEHMDHVRGLAPRTRRAVLRIVREFLRWRFGDRPVVIPAIKPEHVKKKRVSPHLLRHTTAMHLLQSGVPFNVIALWLGHESTTTTHRYVEANLAMKEKALARLEAPDTRLRRFRAPDALMQFLQAL